MKVVLFRGSTHEADGATRMLVQLANELSTRGHDVTVLRWKYRETGTLFPLRDGIDVQHARSSRSKLAARHSRRKRGARGPDRGRLARVRASLRDPIGSILLPGLESMPAIARVPALLRIYRHLWRHHHREVVRQYRDKLEELSPDVVVTFFTRAHFFVAEACWQLELPVVCSMHSDPRTYARRLGSEFTYQLATVPVASITVLDESFRDVAARSTTDRLVVLPNWIDTSRFLANPDGRRPRRVISVGRLIEGKNHRLLVDAWALLAPEFPEWSLDIFGAGPLEEPVRAQIERLGLGSSISVREPLDEIEKEYASSALHVLPSLQEGFGLVVVEAMASGLPSVVLEGSGPPVRMIHESRAGLICSPRPDALADAMRRLMNDDHLRREMGARGLTFAEQYADDAVVARWEDHLQAVVANERP